MPPPVFIDINYFFYQIYHFFIDSYFFIVNLPWSNVASYLKTIGIFILLLAIIGIIYNLTRISQLRK